jgi:hypothetical protein
VAVKRVAGYADETSMPAVDDGAEERVLIRVVAADPRSDWIHGYSAGLVSLTHRRLAFAPSGGGRSADHRQWEVAVDDVERISVSSVPIWICGLVRIWVPGLRVVVRTGGGRTLIVGRARARKLVKEFEVISKAKRRSHQRTDSTTAP